MLKETETEETIVFFVAFLSLVAVQLGGGRAPCLPPPGYAYVRSSVLSLMTIEDETDETLFCIKEYPKRLKPK